MESNEKGKSKITKASNFLPIVNRKFTITKTTNPTVTNIAEAHWDVWNFMSNRALCCGRDHATSSKRVPYKSITWFQNDFYPNFINTYSSITWKGWQEHRSSSQNTSFDRCEEKSGQVLMTKSVFKVLWEFDSCRW